MFLKYTTGAVEFVAWVCATAAAHTVFDDGLLRNLFLPRGNTFMFGHEITATPANVETAGQTPQRWQGKTSRAHIRAPQI